MVLKLAFGCQARTGKDTACKYLQETYGGVILHFSDPLYQILYAAQDICGFPRQKDAQFLQYMGTEWARGRDPDVWVRLLLARAAQNPAENVFVADLRFPNELQGLQAAGFKCLRIVRSDRPIDRDATHVSETALIDYQDWDAVIVNDGTLEEFYKKLKELALRFC